MPPADTNFNKAAPPKTYDDKTNTGGDRTKSQSGFPEGNASLRRPYSGQRIGSPVEQTGAQDSNLRQAIPVTPKARVKAPDLPAIVVPEDEEKDSGKVPVLKLDEKVASRAAPERRRIVLQPQTTNASLTRIPAYPKSDWTAVESDSKVAKK